MQFVILDILPPSRIDGLFAFWKASNDLFKPQFFHGIPIEGPDSNSITVCWKFNGKMEGTFEGMQPTHEFVCATGVTIYRFDHNSGKVNHMRIIHDGHDMRQQMGMLFVLNKC
jgi:hypothetical protein